MRLLLQGVNMVAAETIMRRLLPQLPPLRFQHLMRVICHEILHHVQDDHPTRRAHTNGSASSERLHDMTMLPALSCKRSEPPPASLALVITCGLITEGFSTSWVYT